jgi:hypothetical protein
MPRLKKGRSGLILEQRETNQLRQPNKPNPSINIAQVSCSGFYDFVVKDHQNPEFW